ncbi:Fur family transcriptional regulator [Mariprofundus erugo]|nr:transcriptional repressor [Mariprofundus erugo]
MKHSTDPRIAMIEAAIRNAGGRVTASRVRLLDLLQSAREPLCQTDIENLIESEPLPAMDRVTIYRVLDWLTEAGLAHKAADGRGVFRFTAAKPEGQHEQHAHLRCTGCGGTFCLDMAPPPRPVLPRGFRFGGMALDIRGECPRCVGAHA